MVDGAGLIRKLQLKPGQRLRLMNAPGPLAAALRAGGATVAADGRCEAVLAFCGSPEEVETACGQALAALEPDGLLWFAYRKGAAAKASGLSRDVGWSVLGRAGYRGVRSIAIDEDWTGLRFRETAKVKAGR